MTRDAALAELRRAFRAAGLDEPALDARLLAAAALGTDAVGLLAAAGEPIGPDAAAEIAEFARRRMAREPVARILGTAEFWGLPFRLSPDTLVPRPDTETLVEAALALLPDRDAPARILDLGTGSGCILVALLHERRAAWGVGIDRSPAALAAARGNARVNGIGARAAFVASDWAAGLSGRFDLAVSNPPYIPEAEIDSLDPEVSRHDPLAALAGGPDGLDAVRAVLHAMRTLLAPGASGAVEFGHDQADRVAELAQRVGLVVLQILRDLGGHRRAITLRQPEG